MPKLSAEQIIAIILANGFELDRHRGGSHRQYKGIVNGKIHLVTIAAHDDRAIMPPGTTGSIIRQSGLSRKLFRKQERHYRDRGGVDGLKGAKQNRQKHSVCQRHIASEPDHIAVLANHPANTGVNRPLGSP